ncbi:MAG: trigger factor [Verrucomicrobiota bacterium JB023]|nr:trigger factor [Verrucomicrobiota bacterium JB023]
MNISVQKLPNCQATLEVEIPAEAVNGLREDLVKSFMNQARIPGYRPGKAPRKLIEKRFAGEISEELDGRLMEQAVQETIKQEDDLKIIDISRPDKLQHEADGSARMSATLIIAPEFTLPEYKGLDIEIPKMEVTDELVDRELDNLRRRQATYEDLDDRAVEEGDIIVISHTATINGQDPAEVAGQAVGELAETSDYWMKVEENTFLPGFCPQLVGANVGETREVKVTLPSEGPIESLHGQELVCQVTVQGIKDEILPDDDALVQALMPGGSMDDLVEIIQNQMLQQLQREKEQLKESKLLEQINNAVDFELPDEFVQSETQGQADQIVENALRQGASEEEIAAREEEIFKSAGDRARNNLKTQFLLAEIAAAENLKANDQEIIQHIEFLARQANKPVKSYTQKLVREGKVESIRHRLMISKTIDFLLESANVTEVEPSKDESESAE